MPVGPAFWPGRSAAKSIDDAEHGTRIERAMVQVCKSVPRSSRGFRKKLAAHPPNVRADLASGLSGET
jgi:hypothetical protein